MKILQPRISKNIATRHLQFNASVKYHQDWHYDSLSATLNINLVTVNCFVFENAHELYANSCRKIQSQYLWTRRMKEH